MQDELRLRTRMIDAGLWLSVVLLLTVSGWIAATWARPHRGGLTAMVIGAGVATAIVALLPRERIVAGRLREPFFLTWSIALIAFITVAAGLDAGVRSPVVLMLFLTLVYAALSYPRWLVAVVSVVSLVAVLVLSQVAGSRGGVPTDPVYLAGLMLTLALTGVMCVCQARIQENARSELGRLSRCDHLTDCLNRLGLGERLNTELSRAKRTGSDLSLVLLDFDHFKAVNDSLGHAAGDELLCWAARAMTEALRPVDALGRLGGDEFAVLLPDVDVERASQVAARLRLVLSSRISASAGVACTRVDGINAEALYHHADRRLYEAKQQRPAGTLATTR